MRKNKSLLRFSSTPQFNMTPMIDVVFLLIIFFMLICQFIVQENYKLVVPDDCANAIVTEQLDPGAITVSVFPKPVADGQSTDLPLASGADVLSGSVLYAVRSHQFDPADSRYQQNPDLLIADMTERIATEASRKTAPLVHLRADKDLTYGDVQQALMALAGAQITRVQLAAFRGEQQE